MINFISSFWVVLSVACGWRTAKLFEPLAADNHSLLCVLLLSAFPIIEPISDRNYSPSLFTQQSIFAAVSFLWLHWYFPVHLDPSVLHLGHHGLVLQKEIKMQVWGCTDALKAWLLGLSSLQRLWICLEGMSICHLLLVEVVYLTSGLLEINQCKKQCWNLWFTLSSPSWPALSTLETPHLIKRKVSAHGSVEALSIEVSKAVPRHWLRVCFHWGAWVSMSLSI